ncbi:myosin-11-like [Hibiscus syriacus]|uniref:myosin-11-like n=1 Tax=Hibiscus syriacus TaxID=106335 RepID=UPI00192321FA|nr:myosin-11-like [Hibiscus syriacus]
MSKIERSVSAQSNLFECEEENAVNERENSGRVDEEITLFAQKKLRQREYDYVENKQNGNIENLQVTGVGLLSKIQNLENRFAFAFTKFRVSELSIGNIELSKFVAELDEQVQLCFAEMKQFCTLYSFANLKGTCGYYDLEILGSSDLISQKQQLCSPYQERFDMVKELSEKLLEIEKLKSDNLLKEHELEGLRYSQKELETWIYSAEKEKSQLEEDMDIMRREVVVTAKFFDDLRSEMVELNSNMDSKISPNKILKKKSFELEDEKQEVKVYSSELEEEDLLLSDQLCGLEEKIMYLIDEKESYHIERKSPEFDAIDFKDEIITRLEDEIEVERLVIRRKMEEVQRQWFEVRVECDYLKVENLKLIKECSMLQKENGELWKQKTKLNEYCTVLETELNKVDNLQRKNQLLEEEILAQLQKKLQLQKVILALKETISETKSENEMLEASFRMLSREHEELEAKTTLFVQKILNSCKRRRVALEEGLETYEALPENELIDDKQNSNTENPRFIGVELAEALELFCLIFSNMKPGLPKVSRARDAKTISTSAVIIYRTNSTLKVSHVDVPGKSTDEGGAGNDRRECKVSLPKIEMSALQCIKYAEVDAVTPPTRTLLGFESNVSH